jgi:hypothetical protein
MDIMSKWPRGLNGRSAAACLLGLGVRVPLEALMSVSCECCVLSGRVPYEGPIICQEESYSV